MCNEEDGFTLECYEEDYIQTHKTKKPWKSFQCIYKIFISTGLLSMFESDIFNLDNHDIISI